MLFSADNGRSAAALGDGEDIFYPAVLASPLARDGAAAGVNRSLDEVEPPVCHGAEDNMLEARAIGVGVYSRRRAVHPIGNGTVGIVIKRVHVGAGSVIAGVLEPPSANPTTVEDEVMIGANAVILEGIRIGKGAVVAAGAIVTEDVPPGVVVAGCPARIIKDKDWKTIEKTQLLEDLRNLGTDGKGN